MMYGFEAFLIFLGNVHKAHILEENLKASGRTTRYKRQTSMAVFLIMDAFGKDVEWIAA